MKPAKREQVGGAHCQGVRNKKHLNALKTTRDDPRRFLFQAHIIHHEPTPGGGEIGTLIHGALGMVDQPMGGKECVDPGVYSG